MQPAQCKVHGLNAPEATTPASSKCQPRRTQRCPPRKRQCRHSPPQGGQRKFASTPCASPCVSGVGQAQIRQGQGPAAAGLRAREPSHHRAREPSCTPAASASSTSPCGHSAVPHFSFWIDLIGGHNMLCSTGTGGKAVEVAMTPQLPPPFLLPASDTRLAIPADQPSRTHWLATHQGDLPNSPASHQGGSPVAPRYSMLGRRWRFERWECKHTCAQQTRHACSSP